MVGQVRQGEGRSRAGATSTRRSKRAAATQGGLAFRLAGRASPTLGTAKGSELS